MLAPPCQILLNSQPSYSSQHKVINQTSLKFLPELPMGSKPPSTASRPDTNKWVTRFETCVCDGFQPTMRRLAPHHARFSSNYIILDITASGICASLRRLFEAQTIIWI
eukprot:TRINITY_DN17572_c0_g1_i1.p1 TRINITY_DN17572_c0_g1~~TRINITY_DN17572_c0_g1_i1.p1  ORF type:complete len:117 (-),score=6.46 TRINITY_DN17572_c0_g1_i1:106-432(-)